MDDCDDESEPTTADEPKAEPVGEEPAEHHRDTLDWVNQRRYGDPPQDG